MSVNVLLQLFGIANMCPRFLVLYREPNKQIKNSEACSIFVAEP